MCNQQHIKMVQVQHFTAPRKMPHYWAARQGYAQSRNGLRLCRKRQNGGRSSQKALRFPFPPSMGPIFAWRGQVISGLLANRFESQFGTNTKLLRKVIGPKSTPNDRLNTLDDDVVSRCSCEVFSYKKRICFL